MRSTLIILAMLILIGGGFALYSWMQPRVVTQGTTDQSSNGTSARPTRPTGSGAVIGSGTSGWVKRWNTKTGELASQFRADRYDPQKDGTILVDKPQAEFMLDEGRLLRVEGASGSVIIPQTPGADDADPLAGGGGMQAPPSRGTLKDVRLTLFESVEDADAADPYLTIAMNNAAFDNDTFRITTESFVNPAGEEVPGDQVPIVVRGKDHDFDGRGLVVRWNDFSQRLELLEIAHGEKMVVKNPEMMQQFGQKPKAESAATKPGTAPATKPAKGKKKKKRKPATVATTRAEEPKETLYQATFERDVQITQGDEQLVLADTLSAEFLLGAAEEDDAGTSSSERSRSSKQDNSATTRTSAENTADVDDKGAPTATTSVSVETTQPATTTSIETTQPATTNPFSDAPVIVRWQGKLRVTPIPEVEGRPLEPGQGVVHLTGAPLQLKWQGTTITCGSATYSTGGEVASFDATDAVPVVTMTDKRGSVVTTRQMTYSEADGTAVLSGVSIARLPTSEDPAQAEVMQLSWDRTCILRLVDDGSGDRVIDHADIEGNVAVEHPQLGLTSDKLQITFAPSQQADNSIELERLIASGAVQCVMKDARGDDRSIRANRIELETEKDSAGKIYPRTITADDDVVASDAESTMTAQHVVVKLRINESVSGMGVSPMLLESKTHGRDAHATQDPPSLPPGAQIATTQADGSTQRLETTQAESSTRLVATTQAGGSAPQAPATSPAGANELEDALGDIALESLVAHGSVKLVSREGAEVTADRVLVNVDDERKTIIMLFGKPGEDATLTNGDNTLSGGHIVTTLEDQRAEILGPGALHAVRVSETPGTPDQPFDLTWRGGGTLDGPGNRVVFRQGVVLTITQPDGAVTKGEADRAEVTLADRAPPATQPTTDTAIENSTTAPIAKTQAASADSTVAAASTSAPTSAPTTQDADGDSPFAGGAAFGEFLETKEPIAVELSGNVKIESAEIGADGSTLRGVLLKGETLKYDLVTGEALIPGLGQMLVQDHRPVEVAEQSESNGDRDDDGATSRLAAAPTRRGDNAQTKSPAPDRGSTAFEWKELLSYSDAQQVAIMQGDVAIHHVPDPGTKGRQFWMTTQRLRAELEPVKPSPAPIAGTQRVPDDLATTAPAPTTSTQPSAATALQSMSLKRLTADGGVRVEAEHQRREGEPAQRIQLDARDIEYDSTTGILIARGTPEDPVRVGGDAALWEGSVEELRWDTRNDQFEITKGRARMR